MTSKECIKYCGAVPSTNYIDRYDVNGHVNLIKKKLTKLPIQFGIVNGFFYCGGNQLTSLNNAPIEIYWDFRCENNQLTTLEHLPKYIDGNLVCTNNPFQNLNGLKDVEIKESIWFHHETEKESDYWIKALYNTDLDTLEYHYDNHKYGFFNKELERYVMNELEEIIKVKRLKRDLNV